MGPKVLGVGNENEGTSIRRHEARASRPLEILQENKVRMSVPRTM